VSPQKPAIRQNSEPVNFSSQYGIKVYLNVILTSVVLSWFHKWPVSTRFHSSFVCTTYVASLMLLGLMTT
jgi:hypothetical protein